MWSFVAALLAFSLVLLFMVSLKRKDERGHTSGIRTLKRKDERGHDDLNGYAKAYNKNAIGYAPPSDGYTAHALNTLALPASRLRASVGDHQAGAGATAGTDATHGFLTPQHHACAVRRCHGWLGVPRAKYPERALSIPSGEARAPMVWRARAVRSPYRRARPVPRWYGEHVRCALHTVQSDW